MATARIHGKEVGGHFKAKNAINVALSAISGMSARNVQEGIEELNSNLTQVKTVSGTTSVNGNIKLGYNASEHIINSLYSMPIDSKVCIANIVVDSSTNDYYAHIVRGYDHEIMASASVTVKFVPIKL